jgi:hypothetical protein
MHGVNATPKTVAMGRVASHIAHLHVNARLFLKIAIIIVAMYVEAERNALSSGLVMACSLHALASSP